MADIFNMSDTWNDAGVTFTAIKMDVTDTASDAGSNLLDLQVGGQGRLYVRKDGSIQMPRNVSLNGTVSTDGADGTAVPLIGVDGANSPCLGPLTGNSVTRLKFGAEFSFLTNAQDVVFKIGSFQNEVARITSLGAWQAVGHVFSVRNGTNAQTFNIYNTYTDASNYERARMGWSGDAYEIKPEAAGTGTVRELHISGLPTTDPAISGVLWNDAGTVKVSA